MNSAFAAAGGRAAKVKVRYEEGEVLLLNEGFCTKDMTRMLGGRTRKIKVKYDDGGVQLLDKDKMRKSNSEGLKGKMSDLAVVKKLGNTEIKLSTQESLRNGTSPQGIKRIRIDEVLQYFTKRSKAEVRAGEESKVCRQGFLSSRCEVRLEKICVPFFNGQQTECRERPLTKKSCQGNTVQALIVKPKTIKQVMHNSAVHSQFNEGHEDDLFGQSNGQVGYGSLKKQKNNWEGKLISKEESSGDESSLGSKSDLVRSQSPARWSLACQTVSSRGAERSDTPERF